LIVIAAVTAFLLYRPDTDAPFEIVDFSETLPFLAGGNSFGERFGALMTYYLGHGRAAIGLSAGLAAKWSLFGWWTPGWQYTRFVVGMLVVVLAWQLLRRLGADRWGATAGAALFIVSETAAPGWLRPSVNEPFGTLLLLWASLLACRFGSTATPHRTAAFIATLLFAMVMVKETLVGTAVLPVAIALCVGAGGRLSWPRWTSRHVILLGYAGAALAAAGAVVLWGLRHLAPDGYLQQVGVVNGVVSNAIFGALHALVPFTPVTDPPTWVSPAMDAAWLVLLLAGWRSYTVDAASRRHRLIVLGIALALLFARIIVFLPWQFQHAFYSIPFHLAVALLLAGSVSGMMQGPAPARIATVGLTSLVIAYAAAGSAGVASRYFAMRRLTDSLVDTLSAAARASAAPSLLIVVPHLPAEVWWGIGPTIERFGNATGRPLPPIADILCDDARSRVATRGGLPVPAAVLRWQCRIPAVPVSSVTSIARRYLRPTLAGGVDTLAADVLAASADPSTPDPGR